MTDAEDKVVGNHEARGRYWDYMANHPAHHAFQSWESEYKQRESGEEWGVGNFDNTSYSPSKSRSFFTSEEPWILIRQELDNETREKAMLFLEKRRWDLERTSGEWQRRSRIDHGNGEAVENGEWKSMRDEWEKKYPPNSATERYQAWRWWSDAAYGPHQSPILFDDTIGSAHKEALSYLEWCSMGACVLYLCITFLI
jgi:hypothetical protein